MKLIYILMASVLFSVNVYAKDAEDELVGFEETLSSYQKKGLYKIMLEFDARFDKLGELRDSKREYAEYKLRQKLDTDISSILTAEQLARFRQEQLKKG